MKKPFERFDMARDPVRTKWYLKPLTKILSWPNMFTHRPAIHFHGVDVPLELPVPSLYSVHIEYEYLGKFGDCVDLNTLEDTWYTYPETDQEFAVTKMALATEELYFAHRRAIGKPCPPGLA